MEEIVRFQKNGRRAVSFTEKSDFNARLAQIDDVNILRSVSPRNCEAVRLCGISGNFIRIKDTPGTDRKSVV